MFISSTVHPPIHQNTLEFLELSDYILQYIAQIHVPCLPPHPQKDDCWWSFRSPNYPLLTSWEWPGLAKEELQKMEDRARRGEKETVRKPLEWLDPLFSGKILLLRKNQECGSFHWGWFWRWCVWLWFDDLMFRWDFSSLRCTWDVIKPWDIHHTPLHRGPAEAVCSTFGGFEDLSKGSHRESGIGGWKMGVFLPRWWAQSLWDLALNSAGARQGSSREASDCSRDSCKGLESHSGHGWPWIKHHYCPGRRCRRSFLDGCGGAKFGVLKKRWRVLRSWNQLGW